MLDYIYHKFLKVDEQKVRSLDLLQSLTTTALELQGFCFIVIDGLDECIGEFSTAHEDSQGEIINWLESLLGQNLECGSDDRCTRLLISGQRNGFLEERLAQYPQIQLETINAHVNDIKAFAEDKSCQIQRKFGIHEDVRRDLVGKVCAGAKGEILLVVATFTTLMWRIGMFLFAKIVLGNLLDQLTLGHVKRELRDGNFPKGLGEA